MGTFGFDEQYAMFDITPVENQFILEYMPGAKGEFVKVYLYGLVQCYHPQDGMNVDQMSRELGIPEETVHAAFRYWERRGLVRRIADNPPVWRYVSATQRMLGGETPVDPAYAAFAEALYEIFGNNRQLHTKEIGQAYEWVEDLGLPSEIVLALVKHKAQTGGWKFSFRSAEKLAIQLKDANVRTVEDAEAFFGRDKAVFEGAKKVLRRMGKRRDPSEDEMALWQKWTQEWDYEPDAVLEACKDTVRGDPNFAYLNGILEGKRRRTDGQATSADAMRRADEAEQERIRPMRELMKTMRIPAALLNDGTLALYDRMRALYDDEVILLAGAECAKKRGGNLEDVIGMLESWRKRGLADADDVRAYIDEYRAAGSFITELYEAMGVPAGPAAGDRALVQKWEERYGFSPEMIRHCAGFLRSVKNPMPYLDRVLEGFAQKGIRTPAEADAEQARRQSAAKQAAPVRPAKAPAPVPAQQYEQREYKAVTRAPAWVLQMIKEMGDDEQRDPE